MRGSQKAVRFAEVENEHSAARSSTSQRKPMGVQSQPAIPTSSSCADIESRVEDSICDYDTSVTRLYQLIEASDWDGAAERCRTHPDEVRTWVIRRHKDPKKIRWKLLPLHTAIIFQSPECVVFALLQEYPEAIQATDDQGMTPLHLAFRHYQHDEALLKLLLEAYPHGIINKDYRGRTPLDLAMKRNGKFSAKFLHTYSTICMEITLQSVDESWRNKVGNVEEIECPGDEEDEMTLLESKEETEPVREQPEVDEDIQETEVNEYDIDEIAQLEQAEHDVNENTSKNIMGDEEHEQQVVSKGISVEADKLSKGELLNVTKTFDKTESETKLEKEEDEKDHELDEFCSIEDEDLKSAEEEEQALNVPDNGVSRIREPAITALQEKHEKEIAVIRQHYEDKIQAMSYQTMKALQKLHHDTKAANRAIKEQYCRDLQMIKNHLTTEEKQEADNTFHPRNEIVRLQQRLGEEQQVQSSADTRHMTRDIRALQRDQLLLQRLVRDQQKELDTAQAIRALMLKSLWQQDEEEGAARKVVAEAITTLANRIQSRLELLTPETPFDETRDAIETTELRSIEDGGDDDISTITDNSPF
jgi:hypothetical protein